MLLYQLIPRESIAINCLFWLGAGVCFYNLQNYEAAIECMEKSLIDAKNEAKNEAEAYLTWSREALA